MGLILAALLVAASPEPLEMGGLLHIGPFSGFGAGVQAGTRALGVRVSAGWAPLLLAENTGGSVDFKIYSSLQISPDLYARFIETPTGAAVGAQFGYRYSTVLGHGIGAGGYGQFPINPSLHGLVAGGVLVFPDGESQLKKHESLPSSAQFSFPGPGLTFGFSLGLAFLP